MTAAFVFTAIVMAAVVAAQLWDQHIRGEENDGD